MIEHTFSTEYLLSQSEQFHQNFSLSHSTTVVISIKEKVTIVYYYGKLNCYMHISILSPTTPSLAWPDPFRTATYRLEIISTALQGSGIVHESKNQQSPVVGECKLGSRDPLIEKVV